MKTQTTENKADELPGGIKLEPQMTPVRVMLRQYIAVRGDEQGEIARSIGVAPSTLSRFLTGRTMDEQGTLKLIAWLFK